MDTRREQRDAGPTSGKRGTPPPVSSGGGTDWLTVLAIAAVVIVIGALIWLATSESRSPGAAEDSSGVAEAAPPDAAPAGSDVEDRPGTLSVWDPDTGRVDVLFRSYFRPFDWPNEAPEDAELSPDGERLVYERWDFDVPPQIYLVKPDGTGRRLTDLPGGATDPTWSPNGRSIAFAGRLREDSDADIFVMTPQGRGIERVAGSVRDEGLPDWSPDGSRLAFHTLYDDGRGQLKVTSVRTHASTHLTPRRSGTASVEPAWSPDGRWIAYTTFVRGLTLNGKVVETEIWRMRPDGTHRERIGDPSRFDEVYHEADWSPDGRSIVVVRTGLSGTNDHVLLVDLRTGRRRTILKGIDDPDPSWGNEGIVMSLWGASETVLTAQMERLERLDDDGPRGGVPNEASTT